MTTPSYGSLNTPEFLAILGEAEKKYGYGGNDNNKNHIPKCRNGDDCPFLQKGTCKFGHDNTTIVPCRNGSNCPFLQKGNCRYAH
jgi:hypothetical protein